MIRLFFNIILMGMTLVMFGIVIFGAVLLVQELLRI
jgi:hypothetical protein